MREILFRGKVLKTNKWVYGSCNLENTLASISGCAVIPKTIGQYTGLRDKNSTRIFEADIVKVYDVYCNETVVGVVEFCDGSFRIYDKDFTSYDRWMYCKVEVIGNVYDNQELLEGDKTRILM